jgi:hypothetical protein
MGQFAPMGEVDGLSQIAIPILRTDPAIANKDGMQEAHMRGLRTGQKAMPADIKKPLTSATKPL